jgi:GH24 family phage-related lysozyme (muramidase)
VSGTLRRHADRELQQEKEDLKDQAIADFGAGKEMDPELTERRSYVRTYETLTGRRMGQDSVRDLSAYLETLPMEADPAQAAQEWVQNEIGEGPDSPVAAAALFSTIDQSASALVSQQTEKRVEFQKVQAEQSLGSSVASLVSSGKTFDVEELEQFAASYTSIRPAKESEAKPWVVGKMLASVGDDPVAMTEVDRFMNTAGSGINGKSFAESFPEAYTQHQQTLVNKARSVDTFVAEQAYQGVDDAIQAATDINSLVAARDALAVTREKYGATSKADNLQASLDKKLKVYSDRQEMTVAAQRAIQGLPTDVPPSKYNEALRGLIGPTVTDDPEQRKAAAAKVVNLTDLGATMKSNHDRALLGIDEASAEQAYMFAEDVARNLAQDGFVNPSDVANRLFSSSEAKDLFTSVYNASLVSTESSKALMRQYRETQDIAPELLRVPTSELSYVQETLGDLTVSGYYDSLGGETAKDPWYSVIGENDDATPFEGGWFDDEATLDPTVLKMMSDRVGNVLGRQFAGDKSRLDDAIKIVADNARGDLAMRIVNGKPVLALGGQMVAVNAAGEPRHVKRLNRKEPNPYDPSKVEDTYAEAAKAVSHIAQVMDEDADTFSVGAFDKQGGYYTVTDKWGTPPVFGLGTTVNLRFSGESEAKRKAAIHAMGGNFTSDEAVVNEQDPVTLAKTPEEAFAQLKERFGDIEGLDFVEETAAGTDEVIGLRMVYRPLWKTGRDVTADRAKLVGDKESASLLDQVSTIGNGALSYAEGLLNSAKERGEVAKTEGVTKPVKIPEPKEGQTVFDAIEGWFKSLRSNQVKTKGLSEVSPGYRKSRYDFLREHEGFRNAVYKDHKGKRTVGIGFNMDATGAKDRFEKALPSVDFKEVYHGDRKLSDAEVNTLFEKTITEYEKIMDTKLGDVDLTEHQRVALLSMVFNNPSLLGPNLTKFVKDGDLNKAMEEILFKSNASSHRGLQNRRVREAQFFMGSANPIPQDLIRKSYS